MTLCSVLCLSNPTSFGILLYSERMKPISGWKQVNLERTRTKSEFKMNCVAKLPNQNGWIPATNCPWTDKGKDYLFEWLHSWTRTICTFESKKWNTSHPRNNPLWIIDKEIHLLQGVSNSKILAWGSMFQVQVLHGTKASERTLNVKRRKKLPYL